MKDISVPYRCSARIFELYFCIFLEQKEFEEARLYSLDKNAFSMLKDGVELIESFCESHRCPFPKIHYAEKLCAHQRGLHGLGACEHFIFLCDARPVNECESVLVH